MTASSMLLADIKQVFGNRERMHSTTIVEALTALGRDYPGDGKPLTPLRLSRLLKPVGIRPFTMRIGAVRLKGYERSAFVTAESVTAESVTARSVTAESVTARSVTAESVTARSVTARSVTAPDVTGQPASLDDTPIGMNGRPADEAANSLGGAVPGIPPAHLGPTDISEPTGIESGDRHSYDQEKRQTLNAWGRKVTAILTGKEDNKVVKLRA